MTNWGKRALRLGAVLLPLSLAACQTLLRPGAGDGGCDDGRHRLPVLDPTVCRTPTVRSLACDLDHLEKHIDWYGSTVAKVPDVWGQARLTLYREQFEEQMEKDLGKFEETLQGSVARSDQAFALSSTALSLALGGEVATNTLPAGRYANLTGNLPANPATLTAPVQQVVTVPPATPPIAYREIRDAAGNVTRLEPIDVGGFFTTGGTTFQPGNFKSALTTTAGAATKLQISLEPTEVLEQKRRYLDFLAQIRRGNEGDDTADTPGYTLQLFRVPVSVLPGKRTDTGHGAEITMTLTPVLGDDLLPTTFRRLVINDLVSQLGFPITQALNPGQNEAFRSLITPEVKAVTEAVTVVADYLTWEGEDSPSAKKFLSPGAMPQGTFTALLSVLASAKDLDAVTNLRDGKPAGTTHLDAQTIGLNLDGLSRLPAQLLKSSLAGGGRWLDTYRSQLAEDLKAGLRPPQETVRRRLATGLTFPSLSFAPGTDNRTAVPTSQLVDVYGRTYAFEIAFAVRQALEASVRRQGYAHLPDVQAFLKEELNAAYDLLSDPRNQVLWDYCVPNLVNLVRTQNFDQLDKVRRDFRRTVAGLAMSSPANTDRPDPVQVSRTAAFAWAVLVDAALLTDKLVREMKAGASARNACLPGLADWMAFYLPCPPPDARRVFNEYVRVRYPVQVFALDPAVQEQNLADRLATRRELQLALSLAFTSGKINFNQLNRFARRLEAEYETIELNRTQVGFGHGPDTFGWRFYPRFQTPDTPGNLTLLARDLIAGGPNRSQLLRDRRLEPGPRECVALVIMPSFVPAVTLDTTSNFFGLANPKHKVFDHTQAVRLGKTVKAIACNGGGVRDACDYRDGDVARLVKRAEQLEARLPMQTVTFPVPVEGNLGGFELFGNSTTDLAPELYGFYGAPGADYKKPTTLFLVGDHFSPLRTRVVVGNKAVKPTLLSRQVAQVDFGPDVIPLNGTHVTVHVATPYGVSRELLVPVKDTSAARPDGYYLAAESRVGFEYAVAGPGADGKFTVAFTPAAQKLAVQAVFASGVVPPKVTLTLSAGGASVTTAEVPADATGTYTLPAAEFAKVTELVGRRFAGAGFDSPDQIRQLLPQVLDVQVTPVVAGQAGTPRPVSGVLRVAFAPKK